jgi:PAS domain S-box-containing protein/putative nucleotidyltransferase with HDIG domain
MKTKETKGKLSLSLLILIFLILAAGILVAGHLLYSNYAKNYRTQAEQQLSSIADLKVQEIVQWRKERLGDANQFFKNPIFSRLVQRYFEHPDDLDAQEQLRSWLTVFQANYLYARVFLLDTQGVGRISVPDAAEPVPRHIPQDAQKALQSGKVTILDLHRDEDNQQPSMAILIPIFREKDGNLPLGVVVMHIDPYQYLYPLISRWPTPSTTAETLIVRKEGNEALFLNELRFQKDTALKLRTSLENINMPAVQAALGNEGIVEGVDYRGVPVIADVRAVPDSPWFMVARIETSEIYAPLTQMLSVVIALVSALLIGAGAGVGLVWRQQNILVHKERAESVEALSESEARYQGLFENASLAISKSTLERKLLYVNPKFASMLGYKSQEEVMATVKDTAVDLFADPNQREEIVRLKQDNPDLNTFEILYRRKDGSTFWGNLTVHMITDSAGSSFFESFIEDITDRKKAEETIKRQLSEITSYYDNAPIGLAILNTDLRFLRINNILSEINGIPAAEHIGKTVKEIVPSLESLAREVTSEIIKTGKAVTNIEFAGETQAQPGVKRIWLESWYPLKDGDEKITGFTVMVQEITARKKAEDTLRESEEQLSTSLENAPDGIYMSDLEGNFLYGNRRCEEIIGYKREELIGKNFLELNVLAESSLARAVEVLNDNVKGKSTGPDEVELISRDGRRIPLEINTSVVYRKGQSIVLAFVRDITERKQADDALKESESRLRRFYESGLMGVIYWNMNGQIVDANDKFLAIIGYSRDDLANGRISWIDMTPPEYRHLDDDSVVELKATGVNKKPFEKEYIRKDGTRVPILLAGAMLDEERFNGVAFVLDISERKQAERTIEKQREEYRTIFDAVRPMITYLDKEGVIQRINKSGADTVNLTPQEIVGKTVHAFFPAAEADKFIADNNKVITSGEPIIGSIIEYTLPSGQKRWAQIDRIPYLDESGDLTGVITFNQDITRRKLAEDNLVQSYESLKKTLNDAINTMVKIVETRDPYTAGHQQKVAGLATAIAREMKLEDTRIDQLRTASVVHDIGKMYVPSDILSKPGRLSDIEYSLIKTHAQSGYDIVNGMDFPGVVSKIVLQHHERLDGSGYPNQLKAADTLLEAKILAVADVIEAMASNRPYRPALGIDKALEEISKNRGRLYDPGVVDICLKLFTEKNYKFKD